MKLGIVGYSDGKFNEDEAKVFILQGIMSAELQSGKMITELVTGLTDQGIPGLAYHLVDDMDVKTVGIACSKASEYKCFDVDEEIIIGDDWGDESPTFLDYIDALVRVGGGKQSLEETKQFKKLKPNAIVVEFDLPREEEK
jgi:hypothetical protein